MNIGHNLTALFAVFLLLCASASDARAKGRRDFPSAIKVIEEALHDKAFPGCSVAVGTQKKLLWCDAFGNFDYQNGKEVETDTLYDLASLTKVTATTATYMRLVALGKVQISDPVSRYLPEFVSAAATPQEKQQREQITLEHLLTHTAGLTAWKPFYREVEGHDAMIRRIIATPLESAPGTRVRYSDPGMMLLGEVAARIGGRPLPELARELVFRPIGMRDTMYNPPAKLRSRIPPTETWPGTNTFVHGIVHDENARAADGITGHAGLFSTAEDLAKLAQEILRGLDGKSRLFPSAVVSEFVRERGALANSGRGLGWGVGENKKSDGSVTRYISHTGFTGTSIRIDLDQKVFIVLLSNRVHPSRDNNRIGSVRSRLVDAVESDLESNER